jgi:hypothetical protein
VSSEREHDLHKLRLANHFGLAQQAHGTRIRMPRPGVRELHRRCRLVLGNLAGRLPTGG